MQFQAALSFMTIDTRDQAVEALKNGLCQLPLKNLKILHSVLLDPEQSNKIIYNGGMYEFDDEGHTLC